MYQIALSSTVIYGVHDPALSDHGLVYGFLNETVRHQKGKIVTFKSVKDFDVEKYKEDLMYAPWHVSEIFNSCDDEANFMEMLLSSIVNTHMPTKKSGLGLRMFHT